MGNVPGFLSNQSMRGDMPSRAGERKSGSSSAKNNSGDRN